MAFLAAVGAVKKEATIVGRTLRQLKDLARDIKEWRALRDIYSPTRERQELSKEI